MPCAYIPEQALPIKRILSHLLAQRKWVQRTVAWTTETLNSLMVRVLDKRVKIQDAD